MQLTYTALALGSLATVATATVNVGFQFPDTVPLHKRQTSGPVYECHSNCGYTILNAKDAGYCDSADWKKLYEACLDCANQYDLWPDYGDGVKAAAEGCGLDAVPKGDAATGSASGTTSAAVSTSAAAAATSASSSSDESAPTTTVDSSSAAPASSSVVADGSTTAAAETSVVASGSAVTTLTDAPTGSNSTAGTTPTTETVSGGSANKFSGIIAFGVALVAAFGLM